MKLLCNKFYGQTFNIGQKHNSLTQSKNQNTVGNNNKNNDDDDDDDDDNNNNNKRRRRTIYQCLIMYQLIQK